MANVVLSDALLKLYLSFSRKGSVAKDENNNIIKLTKLLACIKEFYTNEKQLLRSCNVTADMLLGIEATTPLLSLDNTTIELKDLVLKSKLKLLLTDKDFSDPDIVSYNILTQSPKSGFHYSMTFKLGESKLFAVKHIQQLLAEATKIEIVDPYFSGSEEDNQFDENLKLLGQFMPNKSIKLKISCKSARRTGLKNPLKSQLETAGYINTELPPIPDGTHDRYIKANGVKIHLSSGFYALTQTGKELTYMVEIVQ